MNRELNFEELVECFSAPLFRFARSLSANQMDAEDLVQQTFLTWAEKGHQLQDPSKVKSWLFTTLHRAHLGSRRRGNRFQHIGLDEAAIEEELPWVDPVVVEQLDSQSAMALLSGIDEQYRATVALFYLEDWSYPEIATLLGIPLGTVKSRIARGVAQLRKAVAGLPSKTEIEPLSCAV